MRKSLKDVTSVLVLGTESIIVLPVTRSLGRLLPTAKIYTLSPEKNGRPPWCSSKYIDDCYYFYSTDNSRNLHELIECIKITQADILLPADENYVRFLAEYQDIIKNHVLLPPLPSPELLDQLVPKDQLNEFLKAHDLPHPNNFSINDPELFNRDIRSTPLLLKSVRGSSGTGMRKVIDENELRDIIKNVNPNDYFLQEEIKGEIMGCSFLAIEGDIKAYSIQKNLAKTGYNFSTEMKFIYHNDIYNTTCRLVKAAGYSGLANLDFCIDENDGQAKLIDFNARFWVSLLGAKAAGIDFTKLYCLAALGQNIEQQHYNECIYKMGNSSIKYQINRVANLFRPSLSKSIHTDLWDRVCDPEPEINRYMNNRYRN